MRITMLIPVGIERPSGQRYFQISRCLVQNGHRVRILALHPDLAHCTSRRFVRDGVEVWYVGQMHVLKHGNMPVRFSPLQLLRVLVSATLGMILGAIRSPADVYHVGKPQPINGLAAIVSVILWHRKRFYVDCDDDEVRSNRLERTWQRSVFGFWEWLTTRLAKGSTVNTVALREIVLNRTKHEPVYVPNGVDLDRFRPLNSEKVCTLRSALRLPDMRVVGYFGALSLHSHPVDLLLDAFAILARQVPDVALLIVGSGEDAPALHQRARDVKCGDRIVFTGVVSPSEMPAYYALACVSVDPVRDDPVARARSPLKILESLAMGVPVVTADVGDRRILLAGGGAGVLVRSGDAEALAEGILQLLEDDSLRSTMATVAMRHVLQYSWPVLAAQWETRYARTVS